MFVTLDDRPNEDLDAPVPLSVQGGIIRPARFTLTLADNSQSQGIHAALYQEAGNRLGSAKRQRAVVFRWSGIVSVADDVYERLSIPNKGASHTIKRILKRRSYLATVDIEGRLVAEVHGEDFILQLLDFNVASTTFSRQDRFEFTLLCILVTRNGSTGDGTDGRTEQGAAVIIDLVTDQSTSDRANCDGLRPVTGRELRVATEEQQGADARDEIALVLGGPSCNTIAS